MTRYCMHCMQPISEQGMICPFCGEAPDCEVPEHHLIPGTMLNRRYYVGKSLGQGGFGITYIGRDINLDMRVAIKEFYPTGYVNRNNATATTVRENTDSGRNHFFEKGRERFLKEARALAKFSGEPGIVNVRDFFEENNTAYIVMEYLEGRTLKAYLAEQGTIAPDEALELLTPVLKSLGKIHKRGIIHRDISPDNIMLAGEQVKLLDFGAAREVGGDRSLSIMLKHGYAPEEQYRSRGKQGPWTDIYAICAVLYKCITGITPDDALDRLAEDEVKRLSELGIRIDRNFEIALMKGLAIFWKDRYQSVEELLSGFQGISSMTVEDEATVYRAPGNEKSSQDEAEEEDATVYAAPGQSGAEDTEGEEDATVYAAPGQSGTEDTEEEEDATVYAVPGQSGTEDTEEEEDATVYAAPEQSGAEDAEEEEDATAHVAPEKPKAERARGKKAKTGAAKQRRSKETGTDKDLSSQSEKKKGKKKNKIALLVSVIPIIIVAAVLIFVFTRPGESPYKCGSDGAIISNATIDSGMLREISADSNITWVSFHSCEISDEMMRKISKMKYVTSISFTDCSGFTTLSPLSDMESLENLTFDGSEEGESMLDGEAMFSTDFSGVRYLYLDYWTFETGTAFLQNFPDIKWLTLLQNSGIDDLSALSGMSNLSSLRLSGSDLSGVDLSVLADCQSLSTIEAESCSLTSLEWAEEITLPLTLRVSDNQISSLEPLAGWTGLVTLEVNDNQLTSLDGLEGHEALVNLRAEGNRITDIRALSTCTGLETLELGENEITDITDLKDCTGLTTLVLDDNQLTDLDACEMMIYLSYFSAMDNQIIDIEGLVNVTQLETVRLSGNRISDISELSKSKEKLETVLLADNQISDISPLQGCTRLYLLTLENNQLTDLDALSESTGLYYLSAHDNQITDISGLSNCASLYYIDLGENAITDISPLAVTTVSTRALLLQNNQISDISSLAVNCSYEGLSLYNNPITDFSAIENLSGSELYVSYDDGMDYTLIAGSSFSRYNINLVDVPAGSQANLTNIHTEIMGSGSPNFLTALQADAEISEWRKKIGEKAE